MRINIIAYNWRPWDGYGRFAIYLTKALQRAGHQVHPLLAEQCNAPSWMHEQWGIDWSAHAVSILPPIQKSIILLRDIEGYSYDEIGGILELSPSQVKVYLFRARNKIKKQLKGLTELV